MARDAFGEWSAGGSPGTALETSGRRDLRHELELSGFAPPPPGSGPHHGGPSGQTSSSGAGPAADDDVLFSLAPVKRWLMFGVRSAGRHRVIAALGVVAGILLGGLALLSEPPQYMAGITILLRSEDFGTGFNTSDPQSLLLASRQASGVILRRDSLDEIMDDLHLIDNKPVLPLFGRLKDKLLAPLTTAPTADAEREAMRETLRLAIAVTTTTSGESVDVVVTWPDPAQAAEIADKTFEIFYAEREQAEITPKQKAVDILQQSVQDAADKVDRLRAELGIAPTTDAPAGSSLESAIFAQRDLADRLQSAQLDLDRATSGLQFRYSVLEAAELPNAPISGNLVKYAMVMMFAVIVAVGACVTRDLLGRRVVERSQIERLGIPVLVTARLPVERT